MSFNYVQRRSNDNNEFVVFSGAVANTFNLPDAKTVPGIRFLLKNEGTAAATINAPVGGNGVQQTIDGQNSLVLQNQNSAVSVVSDGSNWMAFDINQGTSSLAVNATAQTAAIAATNVVTAGAAGMYRVTVDAIVTTVGTAGTLAITVAGNNGVAATSQTTGTASLTALGAEVSADFALYSAAGQNITYSTTLAGATGTPQYAVRVRVEYLG